MENSMLFILDIIIILKKRLNKKRIRKDSAGSDDTASMIKGGGYLGARTRQLKRNQCGSLICNAVQVENAKIF